MAFIEVPHSFYETQPYKTFTLPNDSSARTLQDLDFPERGGGFGFASSNQLNSNVRNRFLYWRWCHGGLEVLEDSLDTTLRSNWLKFIFSNTCVLHAEAFERDREVQLLVCTASSAMRLLFRHPSSTQREPSFGRSAASIFHEMDGLRRSVVPIRALQQAGQLRCATARVRQSDGSALFAFCLTTGSVLVVEMPPPSACSAEEEEPSGAKTFELRHSSMMSKLWSGIVPTFASRSDGVSSESATDALFLDCRQPTLLLTVCRDHKVRVWNVESRDLVMVVDLIDCLDHKVDVRTLQLKGAGQGHSLRQSRNGPEKEPVQIGVHLNFVDRSHVLLFSVNDRSEDVHSCLALQRSIACDHRQDLVDWCLVPTRRQAWFLLLSERGYTVSCCDTRQKGSPSVPGLFLADVLWNEEEEEEEEEGEEGAFSCVPAHQDPQEAYLKAVFTPGRFSALALQRAVTALRQSAEQMPLGNLGLAGPPAGSPDALREEIILLVEERIAQTLAEQNAAHELSLGGSQEVSEAELQQIRMLHWSDFFASVVDYQRSGVARPVGLVVDPHTGLVGIIRKAGLSLFRRADLAEVCALAPPLQLNPASLTDVGKSTCTLLRHLRFLQQCVGGVAMAQLYAQLETDPEDLSAKAAAFLQECLRLEHEQQMVDRLSATDNLLDAYIELIEIAENVQDVDVRDNDSESDDMMVGAYMHPERFLFASPLAVDLLSRSVDNILTSRLRLAVSLLLVQQLVANQVSCSGGADWLTADKPGASVASDLTGPVRSRVISLIRNLAYMRWLASARLTTPPSQVLDRLTSQLGLLSCLHGAKGSSPSTVAPATADFRRTLLEVYFQASAGERVRSRLRETGLLDPASNEGASQLWTDVFPVAASCLQAKLCPSSADSVLALMQFLFSRGQLQAMLKATRLLEGWWGCDPALVNYARGLALLNVGQPQKALCFLKAALDVLPALWENPNGCCLPRAVLGPNADLRRPAHLHQVNIALKLMRALEIIEEPLLVVELAHYALSWLQPDDPLRSTFVPLSIGDEGEEAEAEPLSVEEEEEQLRAVLWTAIFKHELAVGRNEEAFGALIKNPDASSCKDCLRQLIVTLCDRRQLTSLIQFDYGELEEEFVAILESRARAVDLTVYNYYKLLYSFHVEMGNFRRAAAVSYEEAMRLGLEVRSLSGLQGQARALLAALTALRLVAPDSQWLLRPTFDPSTPSDRVLELQELRKEYALVKARLRVAQVDLEHCLLPAGPLTVTDTVRCLLKVGLYNGALELCQLYGEPLDGIFEALASRCVALPLVAASAGTPQQQRDLQIEKAVLIECLGEVDASGDYEGLSAVQLAWSLLQSYLKVHADGDYWRCAVAKLLACRHVPPAWLLAEGKRRDRAALLRLFIRNDEVEAAVQLALESIDDAMSRNGGPSVASSELTWLPHLWLRQLAAALRMLAKSNPQCCEMRDQLEKKLNLYYVLLEQTAKDKKMLQMAKLRAMT